MIKLHRAADLFDPARLQHHDLIGHGHRFDLIMGHIDHRGFQRLMQFRDFLPHVDPQGCVKVRQRFVEQKRRRFAHNRPTNRHALALPARKLPGFAVQIVCQVQHLGRIGHARFGLGRIHPRHFQREHDVFAHAHMRIKRIGLKHHRKAALGGRQVSGVFAVDLNAARGGIL